MIDTGLYTVPRGRIASVVTQLEIAGLPSSSALLALGRKNLYAPQPGTVWYH